MSVSPGDERAALSGDQENTSRNASAGAWALD